ncbi:MAG: serine/threonine protein kinase, partial [Rhodomicrobium sp.]
IVLSLLEALQLVHSNGLLHRDISPDNIIVRQDNTPVLIDFGSARRAQTGAENMSAVVKAGFSPLEQYSTVASDQGPWSDIYSLGGTLYFAVTGKAPPPSPDRILNETYVSAAEAARGSFRKEFLDAIDSCLKIRAPDRPQNTSELRDLLNIEPFPASAAHTVVIRPPIEAPRRRFPIIGAVLGLGMLVAFGAYNFEDLKKLAGFEEKPTVTGPGASAIPPIIPGHFNQSATIKTLHKGSVVTGVYGPLTLSHKILGNRHKLLEGHRFRRPGQHLYGRLAKLRGHLWHTRFKHVVIVGSGGAIACDLYCDFDVPLSVYGEFVAAVDEAQAENAGKGASPEDLQRERIATDHGWDKAVAILEEAAAEDDKKAAETKDGAAPEAVPDEQVDVALEGGEAKKG